MGGHAFRAALATALAVVGLALAPTGPASAVSSGRPVAIAVTADGTSYVGFASGGRLLRLSPHGAQDGSVALDRDDPVDGLAVDPGGRIWVDYGDSVSELAADGTLLTHFAHRPGLSCPASRAHDPASAGGIDVTATAVYVAGRCRADVEVYSRAGALRATIDLPGGGDPRGIAWAPAVGHLPARLYVSVPDAGKVLAYDAAHLTGHSTPARTLVIQRHAGYHPPEPGGLATDAKGHLVVVDVANNALYFYNGNQDYSLYQTLGHPPDPETTKGHLDDPTAIAQGGERVHGHLWIADGGNGRIQRWSPAGTTQWMADALPPGDPGAPVNTVAPAVTGTPTSGSVVFCSDGQWTGAPTGFTRTWQRDGVTIAGATGSTYVVTGADVGTALTCVVTAANAAGRSAPVSSAPYAILGSDAPPSNTSPPTITGSAVVGGVLTCSPGEWTGAPTFSYAWQRDGVEIDGSGGARYDVVTADVAHSLTCVVTGTNLAGADSAVSAAVVPTAGGGGGSTQTCRGKPSVTIDRGATYAHDPYVVLHIQVPRGATAVTISNDAGFHRADTRELTGSCRYLWTLPKRSTRTPKTVHVRFPGAASAGAVSDRIVLDDFAPVIHKITAHWSRAKWGWLLTFHVTEHGSGLAKVTFGRSRTNNETRRWGPPVVSNDSSWLQWIRVYDKAGNASNWYHLTGF